MSAKQDKRLRQAARGLAVTLDQAGKNIVGRGLMYEEHKRITSEMYIYGEGEAEVYAVTAKNRPDSYRGIVRALKKGIKSGKIDPLQVKK